jgi:AcrR family transcriptional regulator
MARPTRNRRATYSAIIVRFVRFQSPPAYVLYRSRFDFMSTTYRHTDVFGNFRPGDRFASRTSPKRDLYAHFGSKQAMLAACVMERAERMRRPLGLPSPSDWEHLREVLIQYGMGVLIELGRPEVLAMYRLAILNAESAPDVAEMLDRIGRADGTSGLTALFQAACERGLLHGADPAEMAEVFGAILTKGGILVRMLMHLQEPPDEADARQRAEVAATSLWRLYGGAA